MTKRPKEEVAPRAAAPTAGQVARAADKTLKSYTVGALPILNAVMRRMGLAEILERHLPPDDGRTKVSTAQGLLLLVRNILMSREPVYGVGAWAARHAPELLDLSPEQMGALNDDRLGRCLDRLFDHSGPPLVMAVVRRVVQEFQVRLDELHNDSTSISFYGAYVQAGKEGTRHGRKTHAVTWGFSKDHRPDLKQLLFILTISDDGGVPVYFNSASGNVVDDQTHQETWELLRQLVGGSDFLYVADCKLATTGNLDYLARRGGRFVSVLPGTRREDAEFRRQRRAVGARDCWQRLYDVKDEQGRVSDRLSVWAEEQTSGEGYRLLWYHSTRKAQLDQETRSRRTERARAELSRLNEGLEGPRTRFHERAAVEEAAAKIVQDLAVEAWLLLRIEEQEEASYRQDSPGRPGKKTRYVKQTRKRFRLAWHVDHDAWTQESALDGVFPLITNDRQFTAEQVLRAYKRQPLIEKRFSQFKTDFEVAPVYLKEVSRIQGLLCLYFMALLVQTLLERELRQAMQREGQESLPLYSEARDCRRPTTRRVIDLFETVQRHHLTVPGRPEEILLTELSSVQRQLLKLLNIPASNYGR